MKATFWKNVLFGCVLVISNLLLAFLLVYIAASVFDSFAFTEQTITWRETGEYPYPYWLLYLMPRLAILPISAEIAYELSQMLVWVINGFIVRRFFFSMKPVKWSWVPILVHLILWDPVQILIGTASFYLIAKDKKKPGYGT